MPTIKLMRLPFDRALQMKLDAEQKYGLEIDDMHIYGKNSEQASLVLNGNNLIESIHGQLSLRQTSDGLVLRIKEMAATRSQPIIRIGTSEREMAQAQERLRNFKETGEIDLRPYEHLMIPGKVGYIADSITYSLCLILK